MIQSDRMLEEFLRLISFDSESFCERDTADYLLKTLRELGLTAEEDDVKPNEVIMDPSYKDPTKKKPDDKPKDDTNKKYTTKKSTTKKSTKKSRTTKTGDENDVLLYGALMMGSALAVAALYVGRRKKGSEDNA